MQIKDVIIHSTLALLIWSILHVYALSVYKTSPLASSLLITLFHIPPIRQWCVICGRRFIYRFHRCPILLLEVLYPFGKCA